MTKLCTSNIYSLFYLNLIWLQHLWSLLWLTISKKNLKPAIKVKIDQNAYQLNDFEELVIKAVKTKAYNPIYIFVKLIIIALEEMNQPILLYTKYKSRTLF